MAANTLVGLVNGLMAEKRVTKAELANLLGIKSTQTLNTKLDGTSELSLREAKGLADFCGVTLEDLCSLCFGA